MPYEIFAHHAHVYPHELRPEGTPEALLRYLDNCGIARAVCFAPFAKRYYTSVELPCANQNQWLAEQIAGNHRLVGFGTVDFDGPDAAAQVEEIAALGLRGVKIHPAVQALDVLSEKARDVYAAAERLGLFVSFHTGLHWHRLRDYQPILFDELNWDFPKLCFSMEHVGGFAFFREAMGVLANGKNGCAGWTLEPPGPGGSRARGRFRRRSFAPSCISWAPSAASSAWIFRSRARPIPWRPLSATAPCPSATRRRRGCSAKISQGYWEFKSTVERTIEMSGHSKWSTIKRKKEKTDSQRAKIFTKIGREIAVAVREGGPDPSANSKLKDIIAKAKSNNVPNDNIERIIKKAAGESGGANYEEIVYEGYGPSGVAVIVETLTDNRNRTAGEMRHYFDKYGGNLGQSGCVSFLFTRQGVLLVEPEGVDEDALMEAALEAGAVDFLAEGGVYDVRTDPDNSFGAVRDALEAKGYRFLSAEIEYVPGTMAALTDENDIKNMGKLLDMFDDNDDVQNVWHNWETEEEEEEEE